MKELDEIRRLWIHAGFPLTSLARLEILGTQNYFPSAFRVSSAATISIALSALAASEIYRLRTGESISVKIDRKKACIEFESTKIYRPDINGPPMEVWDPISGLYATANGGFVRLHANFPHHKAGLLEILKLPSNASRQEAANALLHRDSFEFEEHASSLGLCAAACRSPNEWARHPMGVHILKEFSKMDSAPFNISPGIVQSATSPDTFFLDSVQKTNCLSGIRVLSLTRVIAGPVAGRTLASHGADTLWVTAPHLPALPSCDGDTSRGKRTIQLDLRNESDLATIKELLKAADVFIDAYRPGALAAFGLDKDSLHALNPNLIVAELSAYGTTGPWAYKRGFDSLVQTATGFNVVEADYFGSNQPKPMPVQVLDHSTGYLLAFGILAALYKRYTTHSTHNHVEVTLSWTAEWLRSLGSNDNNVKELTEDDLKNGTEEVQIGIRTAAFAKRAPDMTPSPHFAFYPQSLDDDTPNWLPYE